MAGELSTSISVHPLALAHVSTRGELALIAASVPAAHSTWQALVAG